VRFAARLEEAASGLEATLRVRRHVVSELASDLEDLYAAYRAEGLSSAEARRRAEQVLAPSEEALAALSHVHRPFPVRIADRLGEAGRHRVEWAFLVATTSLFCGAAVVVLARGGMVPGPAPFALAILSLAFVTLTYASASGLALYLGRRRPGIGRLLDSRVIVASSCAVLVIAGLGGLAGLSRTATAIQADPARQAELVVHWVRQASSLGALGLVVVLAEGVALLALRRGASLLVEESTRWRSRVAVVGRPTLVEAVTEPAEEEPC